MKYIESLWLNQMKNLVQLFGYGKHTTEEK